VEADEDISQVEKDMGDGKSHNERLPEIKHGKSHPGLSTYSCYNCNTNT
jgi:hypothetical protein